MRNSLSTLNKIVQKHQMKINAGKTKTMVMIKAKDIPLVNLKIDNNLIE